MNHILLISDWFDQAPNDQLLIKSSYLVVISFQISPGQDHVTPVLGSSGARDEQQVCSAGWRRLRMAKSVGRDVNLCKPGANARGLQWPRPNSSLKEAGGHNTQTYPDSRLLPQTHWPRQPRENTSLIFFLPNVSTMLFYTDRGIRRGLLVTITGTQAWIRRFESPLDAHERVGLVAISI